MSSSDPRPPNARVTDPEVMLDLLLDLEHDLGKYLLMPLGFLPSHAPPSEVREAVRRGLLETRRGPDGTTSARELWQSFVAEVGVAPAPVQRAVTAALEWEKKLQSDGALPFEAVHADFSRVRESIREVLRTLGGTS